MYPRRPALVDTSMGLLANMQSFENKQTRTSVPQEVCPRIKRRFGWAAYMWRE
ncbi:hypothetical protein DL89DRAFT_270994 [Linderina pennispora]|uniref:Uncharacterized protein n=1 Tax=Linderina pennispora TaxID=61395 RepID=A0A1Y1VWL0_9FUNG|nr:uncharacterized protein DL89DRAFT_270994 [Linderina pennispora]ORX65376.1 hypothetical protein DL89DRAFT_270994 [Linderina pennispora]